MRFAKKNHYICFPLTVLFANLKICSAPVEGSSNFSGFFSLIGLFVKAEIKMCHSFRKRKKRLNLDQSFEGQ